MADQRPRSRVLYGAEDRRDRCEITAKLPELLIVAGTAQQNSSCATNERWLTSARGLVSYTVPKIDAIAARSRPSCLSCSSWRAPHSKTRRARRTSDG